MPRSRASAHYDITASDRSRAAWNSARQGAKGLDSVISRLGLNFSILGAVSSASLLGVVSANAPVIDSYGKLSEKLGISVQAVQGYVDAAERAGIASNTLFTSLQRGLRRVSEASNGLGEARGALDELGISADALEKLAPEDRILRILDAIQQLGDEGDRVRIAAKIFDSEGVDLVRLTGDAVRDATTAMVEMGRALDEIDVAAVEAMNDDIQLLQAYARSAGQIFTAEMAPAISAVVRVITGATESMDGFRTVSRTASDTAIDVMGAIGNGVEGVDNFFSYFGVKLQQLNVLANSIGARFGDEEDQANLEAAQAVLRQMEDDLYAQTSDETFWKKLEREAVAARLESEETARKVKEIRAKYVNGDIDISLGVGESNLTDPKATEKEQAVIEKSFVSLVETLATQREQIDIEYDKRLATIERFKTLFPDRMNEATDAEVAAIEARLNKFAELDQREQSQIDREREATLRPLESNLEQVVKELADESEVIIAEVEKRQNLLAELGQVDLERKAQADALIIELEEEKQRKLTSIETKSASERIQTQADYAAKAFGIAASLVSSLGGESERAKVIAARASQVEAFVAGISAAERARNHASLAGGFISGSAAAALSWGATLANVAGIEVALQGGTPGGASSGGSAVGGGNSTTSTVPFPQVEKQQINVTFHFDDELIDRDALHRFNIRSTASATQDRDLIYDDRRGYYRANTEGVV